MPRTENILNAALKHGVDAPYSCQGGICSSCMCRTVSGSAEMKTNHILMEDEIEEGLLLACQAYVTSDEIYVDFDDVRNNLNYKTSTELQLCRGFSFTIILLRLLFQQKEAR